MTGAPHIENHKLDRTRHRLRTTGDTPKKQKPMAPMVRYENPPKSCKTHDEFARIMQ